MVLWSYESYGLMAFAVLLPDRHVELNLVFPVVKMEVSRISIEFYWADPREEFRIDAFLIQGAEI